MSLFVEFITLYTVVSFATLLAVSFVVALNFSHLKKDVRTLDFRTIAVQLLTLTIWVTMFTQITRSESDKEVVSNLIFFAFSLVLGFFLIKSTLHESYIRSKIYDLRQRQTDLIERLRELDRQKTDFVSLASHELRGPLSSIKGYSSMIIEGEFGRVPKKLEEPINRIFESSRSLSYLINDFLDVAELEKRDLAYDIAPINVVAVLNEAVDDFAVSYEEYEVKLRPTYNREETIIINADPERVAKIFGKLLDNALKYTPIGEVRVSIAQKKDDVVITIQDTGIGIDHNDLTRLFQKFVRAENASDVSVHGSGLGLYVAKELTEAQHGKIWVESPGRGKGSTFYVAFPIA